LTLKGKIYSVRRHPSIVKYIVQGKRWAEVEEKCKILDEKEVDEFVSHLKNTSTFSVDRESKPKLNRLCYVDDWKNPEICNTLGELQKLNPQGFIHRKDWEWAIGIIAMKRFGKLNKDSKAIGVGGGTEPIPFYLANKISHVYATDLYEDNESWKNAAPLNFLKDPKKYSPFPYREDALTVMKMDGTKLEFPDETFDIAFSFSSIEHFGGKNHSGALKSMKEMERVLKPWGIAVIATEYILNDKEHPEFFNKKTIHSDLIDRLDKLKLVEPLDLRITTNTLNTVIDFFTVDVNWGKMDDEFKRTHPLILLKVRNILFTSIILVFQKQS
jgi:SAM-dependent methyltransferase